MIINMQTELDSLEYDAKLPDDQPHNDNKQVQKEFGGQESHS